MLHRAQTVPSRLGRQLTLGSKLAVLLRGHTKMLLELPGEISVIGKAGFHTHVQQSLPSGSDHGAGILKPHRGYIVLEILVQNTATLLLAQVV